MTPGTPERKPQAERIVKAHALELGSELIRTAGTPRRCRYEIEADGWKVTIEVVPACELPGHMTDCEKDIVRVLRGRQQPLTTSGVMAELTRLAYAGEIELHGESTTKIALARLHKGGVVSNSRCAPRGYTLAERYRVADAAAG